MFLILLAGSLALFAMNEKRKYDNAKRKSHEIVGKIQLKSRTSAKVRYSDEFEPTPMGDANLWLDDEEVHKCDCCEVL